MMRNNGILKWTLHKNKNSSNGRNWQHQPEALTTGHIAYLVKFLGVTEADHPKGIDVIKDCIRKLKLDEEIRRAEGLKTPKAELTISVDGVAIQEPKGKKILYQFPLHQLSYCADDKSEKKYFTFIAKEGELHKCFVFASDKLAEEITLTIGQAFDLAYRRFLDSSGRELELKREIMVLQKRISELESENSSLKQKLMLEPDSNMNTPLMSEPTEPILCPPVPPRQTTNFANQLIAEFAMTANEIEKRANVDRQLDGLGLFSDGEQDPISKSQEGFDAPPKICPPPKGKRQDGMNNNNTIDLLDDSRDNGTGSASDIFGSDPFFATDPFGMTNFSSTVTAPAGKQSNNLMLNSNDVMSTNSTPGNYNNSLLLDSFSNANGTSLPTLSKNDNSMFNTNNANMNILNQFSFQQPAVKPTSIDSALQILDKRIEEMKLGFSRGILTDDFPSDQLGSVRNS